MNKTILKKELMMVADFVEILLHNGYKVTQTEFDVDDKTYVLIEWE